MVGNGYLIALTREHSKRVFAQRDDDNLRKLLEELRGLPDMKKSGRVLELGALWNPIHRCFADGELDPSGGEMPLNHTILGGRQLHMGNDYAAALVRPDLTRFVADRLAELDEGQFRSLFFGLKPEHCHRPLDEKHFMDAWIMLRDVRVFYEAAAENLEAVLFTAKYHA